MTKSRKLRTLTTMILTDGKSATYYVLRGPMRRKAFNAHAADTIAVYTITGQPDYRAMTAAHATLEAPAVDWQA